MKATIEKVTITGAGLTDEERAALEQEAAEYARARIDEEAERDRITQAGVDEFERGNFSTAEDWAKHVEAHIAGLRANRTL